MHPGVSCRTDAVQGVAVLGVPYHLDFAASTLESMVVVQTLRGGHPPIFFADQQQQWRFYSMHMRDRRHGKHAGQVGGSKRFWSCKVEIDAGFNTAPVRDIGYATCGDGSGELKVKCLLDLRDNVHIEAMLVTGLRTAAAL